jgi:hypothetical protein
MLLVNGWTPLWAVRTAEKLLKHRKNVLLDWRRS